MRATIEAGEHLSAHDLFPDETIRYSPSFEFDELVRTSESNRRPRWIGAGLMEYALARDPGEHRGGKSSRHTEEGMTDEAVDRQMASHALRNETVVEREYVAADEAHEDELTKLAAKSCR